MKLSANFDASEFDISDPWPADKSSERQQLATLLQWLRNLVGVPLFITSAYRSPARNASINGAEHSEHMDARAVDVVPMGVTNRDVARHLLASESAGTALPYGQFIVYTDSPHFHLSLPRTDGRVNRQKLVGSNITKTFRPFASASEVPVGVADPLVLLCIAGAVLLWYVL